VPSRPAPVKWLAAALVAVCALALAACGSSSKSSSSSTSSSSSAATPLSLSISEQGRAAKYTAPKTVKGGLVKLTLRNDGKRPHGAQLASLGGGHTAQEALKVIASGSNKTPAWLRAQGGLGPVAPGTSQSADVNLTPGKYLVADAGGPGGGGPPAYSEFTVSGGTAGTLPSTPVTLTAASPAKDKFKWQVSGSLKPGVNTVTFNSKGTNTLHFIGAFRVNGNPSQAQIVKALQSHGKPPAFVDQASFYNTAALDSGKAQTTPLALKKPGKYVLFCPLSDRDGGKPHFAEGLVTTVTVK
jgi:hypothetical protein